MWNGHGGFTRNEREYGLVLDGAPETPLPWVNVIANPGFGTVVTRGGASVTWVKISRESRLIPFAKDPLTDLTAEATYLRDEEDGRRWRAPG